MKKESVKLTKAQREELEQIISKGIASARSIMRAHILLKSDHGRFGPRWSHTQIADAFSVGSSTITRTRQAFLVYGSPAAIYRQQPGPRLRARRLTGEQEATLVALICGSPPPGHERWSLRLIAATLVELEVVEQVSHETVRQVLMHNELKPWLKKQWCIPASKSSHFVWRMETILRIYTRPYDPRFPVVCLDEGSKQLEVGTYPSVPMKPGQVKREDYEYTRNGFCSIFLACEPLAGRRFIEVRERRTKRDWAFFVRDLVDVHYPHAEHITLVLDNLNTHCCSSLYETFPAAEAARLTGKITLEQTPKHGSWLNMAEIELSVLARQALCGRLPTLEAISTQVNAWQERRNRSRPTITWQFTDEHARIKLAHLYPRFDEKKEEPIEA